MHTCSMHGHILGVYVCMLYVCTNRMPKKKPTKVYRYDGQGIWTSSDSGYASYSDYELGSFLGGGAAGVVYEAECFKTKRVRRGAKESSTHGKGGARLREGRGFFSLVPGRVGVL